MYDQNFTQNPEKYVGKIRKKDFYDQCLDLIEKRNVQTVLELGCASGDFLYYLPDHVRGIGVDVSQELIDVAKNTRKKDNIDFYCEDVGDFSLRRPVDLVVMTGFLCTFMDYEKIMDKALSLTSRYVFVNDFFNKYNVDCRYSFRLQGKGSFQTPYNIWSLSTIRSYLDAKGCDYYFEEYEVKETLLESDHPLYNFHISHGTERVLTNRGGIVLDGFNLVVEK